MAKKKIRLIARLDVKDTNLVKGMNTAKMTAAMTAWCPAPAARTAFMPLTS